MPPRPSTAHNDKQINEYVDMYFRFRDEFGVTLEDVIEIGKCELKTCSEQIACAQRITKAVGSQKMERIMEGR